MINLYTAAKASDHAVSIPLEELGTPYAIRPANLSKDEYRRPEYLRIRPSGSLPATVDPGADDFAGYGLGAILLYHAKKSNRLLYRHHQLRSKTIKWLMLKATLISRIQQQIVRPFQAQHDQPVNAFYRPWQELRRIFAVLDYASAGQTFFYGNYSIANIAASRRVSPPPWSRINIDGLPRLKAWLDGMRTQPAILQGLCLLPRGASNTADRPLRRAHLHKAGHRPAHLCRESYKYALNSDVLK